MDINHLYQLLEKHSHLATLQKVQANNPPEGIYWINLEQDQGPSYKTHYLEPFSQQTYSFNTDKISALLSDSHSITGIPKHLEQPLTKHLLGYWRHIKERSQPRQASKIQLEICIGLKAAHTTLTKRYNIQRLYQCVTGILYATQGYCLRRNQQQRNQQHDHPCANNRY